MKTIHILTIIPALFSGVPALAADSAPLPTSMVVVNPGAEDPATVGYTMENPGWSEWLTDSEYTGIQNGGGQYPAASDGKNWFFLDSRSKGGGLYQQVGTITANTNYTLRITLGVPITTSVARMSRFRFGLFAGTGSKPTTPVAVATEADVTVGSGQTQVFSLPLSALAGKPFIGQNLFIAMQDMSEESKFQQILFDAISLTASAPLPPATSTNSTGMEFKQIPAGSFTMGGVQDNMITDRPVQITKDYNIGVTEVTRAQWEKVMQTTPWNGELNSKEFFTKVTPGTNVNVNDLPAWPITYSMALDFCAKLTELDATGTGRYFRLPTEAEWEYACRAGTKTIYSFGDEFEKLREYAQIDFERAQLTWVKAGSKFVFIRDVRKKKPNPWGLYDMHGNASEWCSDWYLMEWDKSPVADPTGPSTGTLRVLRGGANGLGVASAASCRSAERGNAGVPPTANGGFRVVWDDGTTVPSRAAKSSRVPTSSTAKHPGLINPSFEEPRNKPGQYVEDLNFPATMPGWKTTDKEFEVWKSGYKEVAAHEGSQFVELNAWIDGTLYQDSTGIKKESILDFTFAHRGRSGEDTMKLTITDLGADNLLGGGDDTELFAKDYTTGNLKWQVYDSKTEKQIKALGNTVRFAYGAIKTATGDIGAGNFLDAANFGEGVIPPENAMKLDVAGGAFTFGYTTLDKPDFTEFPNTDSPHLGIKRRNRKDGEYFSYAQNTTETEIKAQESSLVHYPAKSEGSGVLAPGQNPGDVAIARFTAKDAGEYHFNITAQLIEEKPTGAGVKIYVNKKEVVDQTELAGHLVPWTTTTVVTLEKGQTVDIAVDNGLDKNWEKDHVLISAKAWKTSPVVEPVAAPTSAPAPPTKPDIVAIKNASESGTSKSDWTYGYGKSGMAFTKFAAFTPDSIKGLMKQEGKGAGADLNWCYVKQNTTDKAITDPQHKVTYPPLNTGAVILHPGTGSDAKMQFIAPATGSYEFSIKFALVDEDALKPDANRSVKVSVLQESSTLFEQVLKVAPAGKTPETHVGRWKQTVSLNAGEKLLIGVSNNGSVEDDSTMVTFE